MLRWRLRSNRGYPSLASPAYSPRRIAILKPSALGDVIHAMPILRALRVRFPNAQLSWVVNRVYRDLLQGHPSLDEIILFDRGSLGKGVGKALRYSLSFIKELRSHKFDLVIDLQGLARTGLMALTSRAPRVIGLGTAREGASLAYTDLVPTPHADHQHAIDRYWLVAEALGVGDTPKRFDVPIQPDALVWAQGILSQYPKPHYAIGAGSRWLTKRWLPESFAQLVNLAQEKYGGTAFFVGTPDELEISQTVQNALKGPSVNFVGQSSLAQLAALLKCVDVMIANDTGPLHLAVGVGTPCVAPYTCTLVRKHGPYRQSGGVETSVYCKGSYIRLCDRLDCMKELTADKLWPALQGVLEAWPSRYRLL